MNEDLRSAGNNILWPTDVIRQHRSGSTLPQIIMACCLMALSVRVFWYSHKGNFTRMLKISVLDTVCHFSKGPSVLPQFFLEGLIRSYLHGSCGPMKTLPNVINLPCRIHDNFQGLVKQKVLRSFWPMGFKVGETDWLWKSLIQVYTHISEGPMR